MTHAAWQLSLTALQISSGSRVVCLLCQRSLGETPEPRAPQNLGRRRGTRARRVPQPSTSDPSLHFYLSLAARPRRISCPTPAKKPANLTVYRRWWAPRRFLFHCFRLQEELQSSREISTPWTTHHHRRPWGPGDMRENFTTVNTSQ